MEKKMERRNALKNKANLVPVVGVEPTRSCPHRILSPARLPIPPHRQPLIVKHFQPLLQSFIFKVLQNESRKSQTT
jgi:hypothetical protein